LIHKQLLRYGGLPIRLLQGTIPEQHTIVYMALPGTAGGLVVTSSAAQRVEFGSAGNLVLRLQRILTLDLHAYPAAMSLCFRAVQACQGQPSELSTSVAMTIAALQREVTRQYEELVLLLGLEEANRRWTYVFYTRWTYMALTRTLPTGFMADAAFLAAAQSPFAPRSSKRRRGLQVLACYLQVLAS